MFRGVLVEVVTTLLTVVLVGTETVLMEVGLNLNVVRTIFLSWIIPLPAGAILSILFFFMFKGIFGG